MTSSNRQKRKKVTKKAKKGKQGHQLVIEDQAGRAGRLNVWPLHSTCQHVLGQDPELYTVVLKNAFYHSPSSLLCSAR